MFSLFYINSCQFNIWAATWQNQQCGCVPSEVSDQPGHPPSLIRVFAVRMKKAWVLSCPLSAQQRLWSDWADAQADLSLRWTHSHIVGFVMSRLIWNCCCDFQANDNRPIYWRLTLTPLMFTALLRKHKMNFAQEQEVKILHLSIWTRSCENLSSGGSTR